MKKFLTAILVVAFAAGMVFAESEEVQMTQSEFEKNIAEQTEIYRGTLDKMDGNSEAYYKLFNFMGEGYVKLNLDVMIHLVDFENVKGKTFKLSIYGKDDSGFTIRKTWKIKRKNIFVNAEGDGILIQRYSIEKGNYSDMSVTISSDEGLNLNKEIGDYSTLQLSDLKFKLSDVFLLSDVGIKNEMFYRRRFSVTPTLTQFYNKNRKFGFYFEYYHITSDALYKEGTYRLTYKLTFAATDTVVYEFDKEMKESPENGNVLQFLDLSTATSGVYKLQYDFTDVASGEVISGEKYFLIEKPEVKKVDEIAEEDN